MRCGRLCVAARTCHARTPAAPLTPLSHPTHQLLTDDKLRLATLTSDNERLRHLIEQSQADAGACKLELQEVAAQASATSTTLRRLQAQQADE